MEGHVQLSIVYFVVRNTNTDMWTVTITFVQSSELSVHLFINRWVQVAMQQVVALHQERRVSRYSSAHVQLLNTGNSTVTGSLLRRCFLLLQGWKVARHGAQWPTGELEGHRVSGVTWLLAFCWPANQTRDLTHEVWKTDFGYLLPLTSYNIQGWCSGNWGPYIW